MKAIVKLEQAEQAEIGTLCYCTDVDNFSKDILYYVTKLEPYKTRGGALATHRFKHLNIYDDKDVLIMSTDKSKNVKETPLNFIHLFAFFQRKHKHLIEFVNVNSSGEIISIDDDKFNKIVLREILDVTQMYQL